MIDRCGSFTSSLLPSLSTGVSEPRNQPKVQSVESGLFKERASRGLCSWLDCVSLICHGCRCCYPVAKVTRSIQRVAASSCRIRWLGDWVARWACQPGRDQWLKRQFISIYVCLCAGSSIPGKNMYTVRALWGRLRAGRDSKAMTFHQGFIYIYIYNRSNRTAAKH